MLEKLTADPVAVYAAALSTLIALAAAGRAIYAWATKGPKAWVCMINPAEVAMTSRKTTKMIISNVGQEPFVVREMIITWHKSKGGKAEESVRFYHGTPFDPAVKRIPNPNGKPNNFVSVPNVVRPGEELHHHSVPFDAYDSSQHWLRTRVILSQRKSPIDGWAAPISKIEQAVGQEELVS